MRWVFAMGLFAACLALAPTASADPLTKPNNDASLRRHPIAPYLNFVPRGGLRRSLSENPGDPAGHPRKRRR